LISQPSVPAIAIRRILALFTVQEGLSADRFAAVDTNVATWQ